MFLLNAVYNRVSSAKFKTPKPVLFRKSFTNIKNSKGPRTELQLLSSHKSIYIRRNQQTVSFPSSMTPTSQVFSLSHHYSSAYPTKTFYPYNQKPHSDPTKQPKLIYPYQKKIVYFRKTHIFPK